MLLSSAIWVAEKEESTLLAALTKRRKEREGKTFRRDALFSERFRGTIKDDFLKEATLEIILGGMDVCDGDKPNRPAAAVKFEHPWGYMAVAHPKIGNECYIAPNAAVIGNVCIGDNSSVWFSAVIRGDAPIIIGE